MNNQPLVTVITPSYNQGHLIEETILSVRHQHYSHIEHIVIDGGSRDDTLGVVNKYSDTIRWVSEPDNGFADAVNKGIRMSSGTIFSILNADDSYYGPGAVGIMVKAMLENPSAGVTFGDFAFIDGTGKIVAFQHGYGQRYSFVSFLCAEFFLPQDSAFIRRTAFDKIGGELDTSVDLCADFDLFTRLGLQFPMIYVPEIISTYRVHEGQRNAQLDYAISNVEHRRRVLEKTFSLPELPSEVIASKNRAFAGTYLIQARRLCSMGNILEAGKSINTAIRIYHPYLLDGWFFHILWDLFRAITKLPLCEKLVNLLREVKNAINRKKIRSEKTKSSRWWE